MTIHTGSGAVIDFDVSQSTWFITAYTVCTATRQGHIRS